MPISRTASDLQSVVATNLKKLRKDRGFTQEQLAREAGINRTYLIQLENCVYCASLKVIVRLADTLRVEPSVLLKYPTKRRAFGEPHAGVIDSSGREIAPTRADLRKVLATNLRQLRGKKDWTLTDLAREAGVSPTYLGQLENCVYHASIKIIAPLAEALDVAPSELLKLDPTKKTPRGG